MNEDQKPLTARESLDMNAANDGIAHAIVIDANAGGNDGKDDMATELQRLKDQLEAVRKEAIEEGRAIGFAEAIELLRKAAKSNSSVVAIRASVTTTPINALEQGAMPRGATNMIVEQIFRSSGPTALTPKQIAKDRDGTRLTESTVGRAIRRLVERRVVEQVGESKSWKLRV